MRRWLAVPIALWALLTWSQTWNTSNGKTVGSSSGNVSSFNGKTVGTSAGDYNKWNNLAAPGGGGTTWAHKNQGSYYDGSGTTHSSVAYSAFSSALTNPSVVPVWVTYDDGVGLNDVSSITDTAGNSYSRSCSYDDTTAGQVVEIWLATNTHTTGNGNLVFQRRGRRGAQRKNERKQPSSSLVPSAPLCTLCVER